MGNSNNTGIEQNNRKCNLVFEQLIKTTLYKNLDELRNNITGTVLLPDESLKYNLARTRPYNIDQQGYPYIIVRVRSANDVSECIKYIRNYGEGIKVCVTCGCHSSHCMVTNSFVIDLLHLCDVQVDPELQLLTAGGGCFLKDVDSVMRQYGLAITLGVKPEVGIGGQVLSGGYGFLARNYGLSVDQLIEVEAVLADGTLITANEDNDYSDLFWGLRGGGGNFGIVTKFVFKAFKLPQFCFGGNVSYYAPILSMAKQISKEFDNLIHSQRGKVEGVTGILRLAAGSSYMTTTWAYFGNKGKMADIPELMKASNIQSWCQIENTLGARDYHSDLQNMMALNQCKGHIYQSIRFIGNEYRWMPESFFDSVLPYVRQTPSSAILKASISLIALGGGVISSKDPDGSKTCVSPTMRNACYYVVIEAYWKHEYGAAGKQEAKAWAQQMYEILEPYKCTGMTHAPDEVSHIQQLHEFRDSLALHHKHILKQQKASQKMSPSENFYDTGGSCYGGLFGKGSTYTDWVSEQRLIQLTAVKKKYDSKNFFSENANIIPDNYMDKNGHDDGYSDVGSDFNT